MLVTNSYHCVTHSTENLKLTEIFIFNNLGADLASDRGEWTQNLFVLVSKNPSLTLLYHLNPWRRFLLVNDSMYKIIQT